MGKIKYFAAYIIPLLAYYTFNVTGIYAYFGLAVIFIVIPFLELVFPPNTYNLNATEKAL